MSNQQLLAEAYSRAFQLSPSEVACLRSNNVTAEFFSALRKTQNISNNCRVLMHIGHQTSALSLMEQISAHQVNLKFILKIVRAFPKVLIMNKLCNTKSSCLIVLFICRGLVNSTLCT